MGARTIIKAQTYVCRGNRRRLRHLLAKHTSLRSSNEAMLIFYAIWRNQGMLVWLLEQGVSPNARLEDTGNTPLMQAAADGDERSMQILLDYGADPYALNTASEDALGYAVTYEQQASIRLLVAAGVDVNRTLKSEGGMTSLDWAVISNWDETAETLRALGAKRHAELRSER